jgi:hypothetical protein
MTREQMIELGRDLAKRLLDRHGEDAIVAVGLHGEVAAADAPDDAAMDVAVVTAGPEVVVPDRLLRVGDALVDVGAITSEAYLAEAAHIGPAWPLASTQFTATLPLHDPGGFFAKLRDAHTAAIKEAGPEVFRAAAGYNLAQALDQQARARRAEHDGDAGAALFAVREAAVLAALTVGLVARTTWASVPEALRGAAGVAIPPGFGETFRLAIAADSDAALAVAAMGEALDALMELARRDGIPFEAAGLDDFL